MGLLSLAQKAFRAVGRKAASMRFSGIGGNSGALTSYSGQVVNSVFLNYGPFPNTDRDYVADVGDVWLNGAVGACLGWISDNFSQPELEVVRKKRSGNYEPIDDHGLVKLVEEPNPEYDSDALWAATVLSFVASGNAYWIKAKAPAGRAMDLWYVPHFEIFPVWGRSGTSFIDYYEHVVDGQRFRIEKEDVIHFRRGLNPANVRSGLPQLDPVLRELTTDNAGSSYCAAVLRNYGVGSVMISPAKPEDTIGDEDAKALIQLYQERTTGENRGRPIVAKGGIKVDQLSFSPEKLALDKMRTFPEDRICAAMRLNPMVVGLTSGSQHKTYNNYSEALNSAWDNCMVPLQRRFARALTRQLLPDLGGIKDKEFVQWNYETVPAMSEDQDAKAKRVALLFEKLLIKRAKACDMLNLECDPEDDLYFNEKTPGQLASQPQPPMLVPSANGTPGQDGAAVADEVPAALRNGKKELEAVGVEHNGNGHAEGDNHHTEHQEGE